MDLTVQKSFCGYLKVSPDFASHTGVILGGIQSVMGWISSEENALNDGQKKMNFFKIFEIPRFSLDFTDLHGYQF